MALHPDIVTRAVMASPGDLDPAVFVDGKWVNPDKYPTPASLEFIEPFDFAPLTAARKMSPRTIASLLLATAFNVRLMRDEEADGVLNDLVSRISKAFVEGAGHEIWWDKPDVFVDEIRGFLEDGSG